MVLDGNDLFTGVALAFVVEGVLYALFPGVMQRAMLSALAMPQGALRGFGLGMMCLGVFAVWLIRG